MDKKRRCCFTGHRPDKVGNNEKYIKDKLKEEIQKTISEGIFTFISEMARGVDIRALRETDVLLKE